MKKRILASVLSLVFILGFVLSPILAHAKIYEENEYKEIKETRGDVQDISGNYPTNFTFWAVTNISVKAHTYKIGRYRVSNLNNSVLNYFRTCSSITEFNNAICGLDKSWDSPFLGNALNDFEGTCDLIGNETIKPLYISADGTTFEKDIANEITMCFTRNESPYTFEYLTALVHYNAGSFDHEDDGFTMVYYASDYLFLPINPVGTVGDSKDLSDVNMKTRVEQAVRDSVKINKANKLTEDVVIATIDSVLDVNKIRDDILSDGPLKYDYQKIDAMLYTGTKKDDGSVPEENSLITVKKGEFELYFRPAGLQVLAANAKRGDESPDSRFALYDITDTEIFGVDVKGQFDKWYKDVGVINLNNSAYYTFGAGDALAQGEQQKQQQEEPTGFNKRIATLLGEALMSAAEDTNLDPTELSNRLDAYSEKLKGDNKYAKGFWCNVVEYAKEQMKQYYQQQAFNERYGDPIDSKDYQEGEEFKLISAATQQWIRNDVSGEQYTGKYVTYKGKRIPLNKTNQNAKNPSDKEAKSIQEIWDGLTPYQKRMLSITFVKRSEQLYKQGHIVSTPSFMRSGISQYKYDGSDAEAFGKSNPGIEKQIHDSLQNVDDSLVDTQNILNVVRSCNDLGRYIVGVMLYGKGTEDGGSYNVYNIYHPLMDSFVKGDSYLYKDVNIGYFPISIPSKIPIFERDGTDTYSVLFTSEYLDAFAAFLYNVSYGFDVAQFGESSSDQRIDINSIKAYFEKGDQESTKPTGMEGLESGLGNIDTAKLMNENQFGKNDMSASCKNMLRSIIQLADLCEFLGIASVDPTTEKFSYTKGLWTDTIDAYMEIYEKYKTQFDAIRLNPNFFRVSDTGEAGIDEPLGLFFNLDKQVMSDQWNQGFAASALYVPLHTNLYDVESVEQYMDKEYLQDFYYKYAFYRKALYINTDSSAVVNKFVSGKMSSSRKIATLSDLLNYRRDIILYVDDNFYNAKDISSVSSKLDYTAIRNGASQEQGDSDQNVLEKAVDNIGDAFSNALQLSPDQILKTGGNKYYSETLAKNVTKFGETKDHLTISERVNNSYILGEDRILGSKATEVEGDNNREKTESIFEEYEYSVEIPYGIVSAVYRSPELYNKMINCISGNSDIIFESSSAIGNTPGATPKEWRAIYNYYMLANLEDQMLNDSASSLDIYAPIFCDIFGNILTESGLVIIPAAANATLCGDAHTPYTIGFNEYYNNGKRIPINVYNDEVYSWLIGYTYDRANWSAVEISNGMSAKKEKGGGYFVIDPSGYLTLRTTQLSSRSGAAVIQWDMINKNSKVVKDLFYDDAYYTKAKGIFNDTTVNTVVETMRGAPIEYIDYAYEGIDASRELSPVGILMAAKLEEMSDSIIVGINGSVTNGNAAFTMPNLAFMSGIEYIVLYVFKIVFAVLLFAFAVNLYLDAVGHSLGIKSALKFIITCLLVLASITIIPKLISYSYDRANRDLLSNESGMIMMLNYVKDFDGAEVGVQSIRTPETSTKLYVKLDDINMPWWSYLNNVLFNTTMKTVSQMYDDALKEHPMALEENVVRKADGLYMDTNDILDSTTIVYYPKRKVLMNLNYTTSVESQKTRGNNSIAENTDGTVDTTKMNYDYNRSTSGTSLSADNSVASYSFPYYVFLEKLTNDINEYNISQDVEAYQWSVGANGHIMTYEIAAPYLSSKQFLDTGYDILGLNSLLGTGVDTTTFTDNIFSKEDIDKMKLSAWFPTDAELKAGHIADKVNEVYDYARRWVAKNRYVLGNIPDEIFIKVLALQCAIKYNQVFGIPNANGIELIDLDTRDMIRFVVASSDRVYKDFSMSFARFVYETSGGLGVILTAFYILVLWLTSFLKPALMIVILGLLILNAVFRKLLFRKESKCIEGFLIGCACLIGCNYLYALMLKITLNIAAAGFGAFVSLIFAILVQVAYVIALIFILKIEIKDWKNSGFNEFITIGSSIGQKFNTIRERIVDKVAQRHNRAFKETASSRRHRSANYDMDTLDAMLERDNERLDNAMNTA